MAVRSASWKASQAEKRKEACRKLRLQRGYDVNANVQKDAERTRGRASMKTKEDYRKRVRKYEEFLIEQRNMPDGYTIKEGHPAPSLEELKAFMRWLIESTKGKIASDGRPTMHTMLVRAQQFVPGFFLETGNEIPRCDRQELYYWIEHELVEQGLLSAVTKPKYNFKLSDFERAIVTLWATDDAFFTHGRHRVQFHFITLQYLCAGSRVSSLAPASENKDGRGLRYKNIDLVLFRADDAPWRVGWRLNQQFVKNNKDPKNTMFGTAIWDCDEPIYAGALYLVALALADNALFGFSTPEEFFEQRIPEGENELVLRWNDEAKDRCIVRGVTAEGVSEEPLTKGTYQFDFKRVLANAGYFVTATVHAMRRAIGAAVDGKYTAAHVAQILTQKSTAVYGNDYLANCSGVDVFNALKGRLADHTHIDYFQGYGQFHEHGLPRRLPIEEEQTIEADPRLIAKIAESSEAISDNETRRISRECAVLRKKIYLEKLQRYQSKWVQTRRDWKVLTRGRERPDHVEQVAKKQALCKIMPELGRLAAVISSNEPLSFNEKASVVRDLFTQCTRDFTVTYRPGEEPVEGRCPVASCGKLLETIKRPSRSTHIHSCVKGEYARSMEIPPQQVKYCWECYTFHNAETAAFEEHCAGHLSSMTSQHYEVMVYRHTTIRAGYCIECMWNNGLSAAHRMRAFDRSTELRSHVDEHIDLKAWPSECPDPSCSHHATGEQDYRRHLHDVHHYHKTICVQSEKAHKKRSFSIPEEEYTRGESQLVQAERPRKRRKNPSTSSPTGKKELKIAFWEPPTMPANTTSTVLALKKNEYQGRPQALDWHTGNRQSTIVSDGSQNIYSALPISSDPPGLTDDTCAHSIRSTDSSTHGEVPIDPRLLETSPPLSYQVDDASKRPSTYGPWERVEDHVGTEQPEINTVRQVTPAISCQKETYGQSVAAPETDNISIELAPPSPTTPSKNPGLRSYGTTPIVETVPTLESTSSMHVGESKMEEAVNPTGPITRARARKQAAKARQKSTKSHKSSQKVLPYSEKEDDFLRTLMRELATIDAVTLAFQERFPYRSEVSLRKRWSIIRPLSRRSTRSRPLGKSHIY
ncbi:uncharacterized protein KD926_007166 [Aspergillus affinis]|uniref:uncharacterized protein n=1 Tax=Aspergillus affinis TaxID=1070780 RepID=UPI0022FE8E48|nr:uncharacterized protein KD926_007166 [Aspergillus affinis]KAI9045863.1 hypothetical protein KD926_007166 [Aspergillus affinis]